MQALLQIGTSKETVKEARLAIMDILNTTKVGEGPKMEALKTLASICNVYNTTISNNVFTGETKPK